MPDLNSVKLTLAAKTNSFFILGLKGGQEINPLFSI